MFQLPDLKGLFIWALIGLAWSLIFAGIAIWALVDYLWTHLQWVP